MGQQLARPVQQQQQQQQVGLQPATLHRHA
jgi:hypothetical protein